MVDYSGNGELFLGSFKTVRAFRQNQKMWQAITHSDKYVIGKEYVADCRSWSWDISILMQILNIPKEEWPGTLITGLHYRGETWDIQITKKTPVGRQITWDGQAVAVKGFNDTYTFKNHDFTVKSTEMEQCMLQHNNEVPRMGCSCGFYSFYSIPLMLEKGRGYISNPDGYHFGVIENYGKVVHCDIGLRSEKMKILGVVPYSEIDDLLKQFPLDVFDASSTDLSWPKMS